MSNLNLLSSLGRYQPETRTTGMLKYLLEKFPSCHLEFLALLSCSGNPENTNIHEEYSIFEDDKHVGNVDLVLKNTPEKYVFFIENKPWIDSSFTDGVTGGDQLKRYANALKGEEYKTYKKTLCLLAIEENKDYLLSTAATAEGESISADEASLKSYFGSNYGIDFVVITWEQVLERLSAVHPEDTIIGFLVSELKKYLFPPKPILPPDVIENLKIYKEKFSYFKQLADDASALLLKRNSSLKQAVKPSGYRDRWYFHHIGSPVIDVFHFGPNLDDCHRLADQNPEHPFTINFLNDNKIFFLQRGEQYSIKPFTDEILLKCGFIYFDYDYWQLYVKLLEIDLTNDLTSKKIVDAVMKVVNQVSEEYKKAASLL